MDIIRNLIGKNLVFTSISSPGTFTILPMGTYTINVVDNHEIWVNNVGNPDEYFYINNGLTNWQGDNEDDTYTLSFM